MSAVEEMIADKLARFRRDSLARDLHDLAWFASRPFDEPLVRKLLVLKVWVDVVDDSLGERPFDAEDVLRERSPREFEREAIGYVTTPVDIPGWIRRVRERFVFLCDLDEEEQLISRCSKGEEWLVRRQIEDLAHELDAPKPPSEPWSTAVDHFANEKNLLSAAESRLEALEQERSELLERIKQLRMLITTALAEKMSALMTVDYLEERAARSDRGKYERALAKVRDVEPDEGDR
jgi:hypothetical protein